MKMKRALLLAPIVSLLFSCAKTNQKVYRPLPLDPNVTYDDVYLIMGQSNASGISPSEYLETSHPDVYQRYTSGNDKVLMSYDIIYNASNTFLPTKFGYAQGDTNFGPEIGIAEVLSQFNKTSYIVKGSLSGSCLQTQWVNKAGQKFNCYTHSVSFVKAQMDNLKSRGKNPRIRGVFWMQGESDSLFHDQDSYYEATKKFVNYLKIDLNAWIYDHFNFVDAYIFTHGQWYMPELINAAKEQFAGEDVHNYCIKTNGEDETAITLDVKSNKGEGNDSAHYDSSSMLLLGQTAGELLIK